MVEGQPGNDPVTTYNIGSLWLPEQELDTEQVGKPGFILIRHKLGCVSASHVHLAGEDKTPVLEHAQLVTRRADLPPASAYELAQHIAMDACETEGPDVLNPIELRGCIHFGEPTPNREQELETVLLNLLEAIRHGKCKGNPYCCYEFLAGYAALGRDILNE